jgi:hypothetical protein
MHNVGHDWISGSWEDGDQILVGTMEPLDISPSDPIFFIHHCNVDRIWAEWQAAKPGDFLDVSSQRHDASPRHEHSVLPSEIRATKSAEKTRAPPIANSPRSPGWVDTAGWVCSVVLLTAQCVAAAGELGSAPHLHDGWYGEEESSAR